LARGQHSSINCPERFAPFTELQRQTGVVDPRRLTPMRKFLEILRNTREVLVTVGAVLAAAIVAVEIYETLRKKIDTARDS